MAVVKYSIVRSIYLNLKKWLYSKLFSQLGVRFKYKLIEGIILTKFRDKLIHKMQYPQSVCNAGILQNGGQVLSIVKNQTFSFCKEIGVSLSLNTKTYGQKDLKRLYKIDFSSDWSVNKLNKVHAKVDNIVIDDDGGLEDSRLFRYRDEVWMYATVSGHTKDCWPCIGKLHGSHVTLKRPKYNVSSPQKNWMPFEVDTIMYLEYSVNPHVVLSYDPKTAECKLVGNTIYLEGFHGLEVHGGAPAVRYDADYFLGVANTQERFWYQERYYAAIFYLFETMPPFRVTHVSRPIRIGGYKERIRYVVGMFISKNQNSLILSLGVCDCDNFVIKVKLSDIWKELGCKIR